MNLGQKIMEGIIDSNLLRATCAHDEEHGCVTVWSSGAAEQIEAMARSNEPERQTGADSLHALDGRAEPMPESRLLELLKYIEAGRPSNYAPWRECEITEMLKILRGEGSPIVRISEGTGGKDSR